MSKYYPCEGAEVSCPFGTENNKKLKFNPSNHGVFFNKSSTPRPIYNVADKKNEDIIPNFGKCKSPTNLDFWMDPSIPAQSKPGIIAKDAVAQQGIYPCKCMFPGTWFTGNLQTKLGGKFDLTSDSHIVCLKGLGILSIGKEAGRPLGVTTKMKSRNKRVLSPQAKKAVEKFGGDQYKPDKTYHASLAEAEQVLFPSVNHKTTCGIDDNLDSSIPHGTEYASKLPSEDQTVLTQVRASRAKVPAVTSNTVMQKVIPAWTVKAILEDHTVTPVRGCVTRAEDAAPYVCNVHQAYSDLRLDYSYIDDKGVLNVTPYKEMSDEGESVFVLRYVSDTTPGNADIPHEADFAPPCTGTGFLGGDEYMIPEYNLFGPTAATPREAALFEIDGDGNEVLRAYLPPNGDEYINIDDEDNRRKKV